MFPGRFGLILLGLWAGSTGVSTLAAQVSGESPEVLATPPQFWDARNNPTTRDLAYPVRLEFDVTYYDPGWKLLWVDANGEAAFLPVAGASLPLHAGQRVRLEGEVIPEAGLALDRLHVTILSDAPPLVAVPASGQLDAPADLEARLVSLEGFVDQQSQDDATHFSFDLIADGRRLHCRVLFGVDEKAPAFRGDFVRVNGVLATSVNGATGRPELNLWIAGLHQIEAIPPIVGERFGRPAVPIDQLAGQAPDALVRLAGVVQSRNVGRTLTLRDETGTITIASEQTSELPHNAPIEILGFPTRTGNDWTLRQAVYRARDDTRAPPTATALNRAPGAPTPLIRTAPAFWDAAHNDSSKRRVHRIELEFVAMYYDPAWNLLWVDENGAGSFLPCSGRRLPLTSGQHVRIEGSVIPDQGLEAGRLTVTTLQRDAYPAPLPADNRLEQPQRLDVRFISVEAFVDQQAEADENHLLLSLIADDRNVFCRVWLETGSPVPQLAGRYVRVEGVFVITPGQEGQPGGHAMWVPDLAHIVDSVSADVRGFDLSPTPLIQLAEQPFDERVRVEGVVYAHEQGQRLILRDETGQIVFPTLQAEVMPPGTAVEAVGYPVRRGPTTTLRNVVFRRIHASAIEAAGNALLSKLRLSEQVLRLGSEEAARAQPVELTGVVTYADARNQFFYLNDSSGGVRVALNEPPSQPLEFGAAVDLSGVTEQGDFAPIIRARQLKLAGALNVPTPREITLEQAMTGVEDSQWVQMSGYLRAIDSTPDGVDLQLTTSMGDFSASLPVSAPPGITVGSILRVRGVCVALSDENRQLLGVRLLVPDSAQVSLVEAAPEDPFSCPVSTITTLRQYHALPTLNRRVQVSGIVIHHVPGRFLLLSDGREVLRVLSREIAPLAPGDRVDVVGLPGRAGPQFVLREGIYRQTGAGAEPAPAAITSTVALDPRLDGRLVRIEGQLLDVAEGAEGIRLFLQTGATVTEIVRESSDGPTDISAWKPGSRASVVGVYNVDYDEYGRPRGYTVQLRATSDVDIVAQPPWWTAQRALTIAGVCAAGLLLGFGWAGLLRRRVARQTALIRDQLEKEALLEAEHREIVSNASDFIFTADLEGRITSFNAAGEKITDYTHAESLQQTIYDLFDPRTARRIRIVLERLRAIETFKVFEVQVRRKDGTLIWMEASAGFIRRNGTPVGVLGVLRDISARKQVEEELRRARDAAEANVRAKSAFVATMSHELRTPLNGVLGMAELLLGSTLDPEHRDYVETLRGSGQQLLTVLNDILEFSTVEAGRMNLQSAPFDLVTSVDQVVGLHGSLAAAKRIELGAIVSSGLPRGLLGDAGRLRQVLRILVGNAVKFTERGEAIVTVVREAETTNEVRVRFEVRDTGIGITPEMQAQLFQPFIQADGSHARRYGGTGLGLAICRQIVEHAGGKIGVQSTPGTGSVFWFTMPLRKQSGVAAPSNTAAGLHVLAICERTTTGEILQRHAQALDLRLECTDGIDKAIACVSHSAQVDPFQLVLVEILEPDAATLQALHPLSRSAHGAGTPVVAVTYADWHPSATELVAHHLTGVLTKPVGENELQLALARFSRDTGTAATTPLPAPPVPLKETQPPPMERQRLHLLLAEDNLVNQRLTRMQLQRMGHTVDVANDGTEAVAAADRTAYDAVFMDCQMPHMDGLEATRQLRARPQHRGLCIIALTANAMQGDREKCLEAGMNDYIAKPATSADLRAALERSPIAAPTAIATRDA